MNEDTKNPEVILTKYQNLVYHLLFRMVQDQTKINELFQEAFLNITKSLPTFKHKSKMSTWISSITINTCYNYFSRSNKERGINSLDRFFEEVSKVPSTAEPVYAAAEHNDLKKSLNLALGTLQTKYKLPIVLFYLEEMSYKEIAEVLGLPMGTVKTNLYRGLKKLKAIVGGNLNEFL